MKLPSPKLPDYDLSTWRTLPFRERVRLVCQSWAVDGYGSPAVVNLVYVLKVGLYVAGFFGTCACSTALGTPTSFSRWWFEPEALLRAVLFSMAFEGLGLGCGSGPLTGRYLPPIGGVLHFARPGTVRLPLFPDLPGFSGNRRGFVDVALYLTHLGLLARALLAPSIGPWMLLPVALTFPLLVLRDKTLFVASRAEHYYVALLCFLVPSDALAGAKCVWLAIWLFAATSKLNRHFPAVVCVMISNSAILRSRWFRTKMYASYPDDLRPSRLAHAMAHTGTALEYLFPVVLAFAHGGDLTLVALVVMVLFHAFITGHLPMGVPIEWNVVMVYGAFVLFGHHAEVRFFDLHSPWLVVVLVTSLVVVPIVGNFFPARVSFLPSMRYYAGNWAYGVWLFRGDSVRKLDRITKSAPLLEDQLERLYDADTAALVLSKVVAFRAMHLHGRALRTLVPRAVDDIDSRTWLDGELVAGLVLGWNFGDGHLHDEQLIQAIQANAAFEPGELRCILVESQPMFRPHLDYRIVDAHDGLVERGRVSVDDLLVGQPWEA